LLQDGKDQSLKVKLQAITRAIIFFCQSEQGPPADNGGIEQTLPREKTLLN
jgi:hypothetical protein